MMTHVALVSALEQNTTFTNSSTWRTNLFGERGFMARAVLLRMMKGWQQIKLQAINESFLSTLPLLLEASGAEHQLGGGRN
jgi:hypothetical protein